MDQPWIWLPAAAYPQYQTTRPSAFAPLPEDGYCVAEFHKSFSFPQAVTCVRLRFSGDTAFQLFCNDQLVGTGPVNVEGDFGSEDCAPIYYASRATVYPRGNTVSFFARVQMMPVALFEYSKGQGGFLLTGQVELEDGTVCPVATDESWLCRQNAGYVRPFFFDGTRPLPPLVPARLTPDRWHCVDAPLKLRQEQVICPAPAEAITVPPRSTCYAEVEMDRIYGGFLQLQVHSAGRLMCAVRFTETDEGGTREDFLFDRDTEYRGFSMHSAGKLRLTLCNSSDSPASVLPRLIATCYPVEQTACTRTDDRELNRVLEVCAHTLQYCRQLQHLDSPRHCEPLACTGDYYIEALMTAFSFGDMTLAEFDVLRTARLLENQDGVLFHTTYSLIWVQMLWETYQFTGNTRLLQQCSPALTALLHRMEQYVGQTGLIETPPSFMFVDWLMVDGYSLHHPPKALGQSCLNMFYAWALGTAARIFDTLGDSTGEKHCLSRRESLFAAIDRQLYDPEKKLYFAGLSTPTPLEQCNGFLPENPEKRYYQKHANILAVLCGLRQGAAGAELIEQVMTDRCPGQLQPYFLHFLLEAVYRTGLREKYTLAILERWKEPVRQCDKGLVEGFLPPQPDYPFDHSHAWGGTPLYALPRALLGLEILRPGLSEIRLSPSLLGRKQAQIELPTPRGMVTCRLEAEKPPRITAPEGITVIVQEDAYVSYGKQD